MNFGSFVRWAFRILVTFVLVVLATLSVSYLQHRFDEADRKKALEAVRTRVPERVEPCDAEVDSRMRGRVSVVCENGRWIVDIVHGAISPVSSPPSSP